MNVRYSIQREDDGPAFIGGAPGLAALGGAIGALAGLVLPMRLIESASFHLYLDKVTAMAAPPLGMTARIGVMLLLGVGMAAVTYAIARWRGVRPIEGGIGDLLAQLRGAREDDEEDAPRLRTLDRHPDAPARRPFSATRDIPEQGWAADWQPARDAEEEDELLLDATAMMLDDAGLAAPAGTGDSPLPAPDYAVDPDAAWADPLSFDAEEAGQGEPSRFDEVMRHVRRDEGGNGIDDYDLPAPTLSDWERRPQPQERDSRGRNDAVSQDAAPVGAFPNEVAENPLRSAASARPVPPPLDLSVARLDELIARLESGLTRRAAAGEPAVEAVVAPSPSVPASVPPMPAVSVPAPPPPPPPQADNDPAFPHDPALAAALRTLRRMNAAAG